MISFANDPNELNTVIRLWPDGPPSSLPDVGPEIAFGSPAVFGPETVMLRNVSEPSLTVFAPDPAKANGTGIIVCPGRVWRFLAWERCSGWSRASMLTGPAPIARQSCTSSPAAATALVSASAGCPWTAGPIC